MRKNKEKTIRIIFPQWQGGNQELYGFGAELLAWLAPESNANTFTIDIPKFTHIKSETINGVIFRDQLEKQYTQAYDLLTEQDPSKIIIFGGDCHVDQAPFAWLNEKYNGQLGVLWIDSHPDIKTPNDYSHAHTMVLGNLLGEGDPLQSSKIQTPLKPSNVMYAGLRESGLTVQEREVIGRLGIKNAKAENLYKSSNQIVEWIRSQNIKYLAIHFDLDVLDPDKFRSVLFAEPEPDIDWRAVYPVGKLGIEHVVRIINDVSAETDVVALGITEHLPWDAWNLKQALASISIMNN